MPPRPSQPPDRGTVTPPQGPIQGLQGEKGDKGDKGDPGEPGQPGKDGKDITDDDKKQLLLSLYETIKQDPQFKGPKGDKGESGEFDHAKMPPIVIQFTDKAGQVVEELPFQFDGKRFVAKFKPIPVGVYDSKGQMTDYDEYPVPFGLKLKPIAVDKDGKPLGLKGT